MEPLIHQYRYMVVTLGATIDWALCTKREQDNNGGSLLGGGNHTAATTSPGSNNKREDDNDNHNGHNGGERAGEALAEVTLDALVVDCVRWGNVLL